MNVETMNFEDVAPGRCGNAKLGQVNEEITFANHKYNSGTGGHQFKIQIPQMVLNQMGCEAGMRVDLATFRDGPSSDTIIRIKKGTCYSLGYSSRGAGSIAVTNLFPFTGWHASTRVIPLIEDGCIYFAVPATWGAVKKQINGIAKSTKPVYKIPNAEEFAQV